MSTLPASTAQEYSGPQLKAYNPDAEDEDADDKIAQQQERAAIRKVCLAKVRSAISSTPLSTADFEAYAHDCLSDEALQISNKMTHEQKMNSLNEMRDTFIPAVVAEARMLGSRFISTINEARSKGWITESYAQLWEKRLRDESVVWFKKKQYLTGKFFAKNYAKTWKEVYEGKEKVKKLQKELGINPNAYEELATITSESFDQKKYPEKKGDIDRALGFLAALKTKRKSQYDQASRELKEAAGRDEISESSVGTWLRRIFESKASPEKIQQFLTGKEKTSLRSLRKNWAEVSQKFNDIETQRKKEGTPTNFHFVSKEFFLEWHYVKRLTYVEEAKRRFIEIAEENPRLLEVRRELDNEDWDSAEYLIKELKQESLEPEDTKKLLSMEYFLRAHRPIEENEEGKQEEESDEMAGTAANEEIRQLLQFIPLSLQPLYIDAMKMGYGVFNCLTALMYNRVWCHQNHVMTEHKEQVLRESAAEETMMHLREGHTKGFENNDASFKKPAIRPYRGEWSPQVLHVGSEGHGTLLSTMQDEQGNQAFEYWTTMIPRGVPYGMHEYIVKNVHHKLKRSMRTLKATGTPLDILSSTATEAEAPLKKAG